MNRMCIVCGEEIDMEKRQYGCVWGHAEDGAALVVGFAHIECFDKCDDIKDITSEVTGEKKDALREMWKRDGMWLRLSWWRHRPVLLL